MTQNVVCHLSSVHIHFDTRIFYKECRSLARAGYDVRLIARKPDMQPIESNGVRIIPFREYKSRLKRILLSPFRMFHAALKQKAKVYHFHDPELLPVGLMLKLAGKKVVYDVHEDYSKQLLYKSWLKSSLLKSIIARTYRLFELFSVLFFNRVAAATDDVRDRFPSRKAITIRNLPILKTIDEAEPAKEEKTKPVIIYAGALAKVRGVLEIIRAMEHVEHDAELWLMGSWESEAFRRKCQSLAGWTKVKFLGLKKPHEVYGYMKAADIGLALLYPIKNYLTSLPVKAFEYLASKTPMIMSDFPFWQEIFKDCSLYTDPYSPEGIARHINRLLEDRNLYEGLKQKGDDLVRMHYSWEREEQKLLELYSEGLKVKSESEE